MGTHASPIVTVDQFSGYNGYADNQPQRYLHPNQQGEQKIAARYTAALAPFLGNTPEIPGPYGEVALPGTLEEGNYDKGGEDGAYHDITRSNQGGAYRNDDADIEQMAGGGYDLCYIRDGEWLDYTVQVAEAGKYEATFRAAAWGDGHTVTFLVDDVPAGTVTLRNTGSSAVSTDIPLQVTLPSGTHTLTLRFTADGENRDHVSFMRVTVPTPQPIPPSTVLPTDPNHDGLYEDLNGNGVFDFNDMALFFNQMDWIALYGSVDAFDFNLNGQIDFNDIVMVFGRI